MKFAILGYGNLGKAFASALARTGCVALEDICVCDSSSDALSLAGKEHYQICEPGKINDMLCRADVLCLAVKSYVFEDVVQNIDKSLLKDKLVISFMAGVTISRLEELLGSAEAAGETTGKAKIALAMPSLAIAKNRGIIAYTKLPSDVAEIFNKFGFAFEVEPENIGKVTAFASCGLGFAAYLIDAFKEAGQGLGFPPETAAMIAALTFVNACDEMDFHRTVKAVAVPGGVTEQGIKHMDECEVYSAIAEAMRKAYDRVSNE